MAMALTKALASLPEGKDAKNESPSKTFFVPFHAQFSTYDTFTTSSHTTLLERIV